MPLESGKSNSAFVHNLKAEKSSGKPTKQALAIAYAKQRGDCDVDMDAEVDVPTAEEIEAAIKAGEQELKHQKAALNSLRDRRAADMALDRAMHRTDTDGHLHIEGANISKAMVCAYLGSEIPQSETLGLDPARIYYLYRDAAELQAAANTYENKPLMAAHVVVSADQPQKYYIVGSVSNVRFSFPYLRADVTVWDGEAISRIQSGEQAEISCGYKYRADMTPGEFEGQKFDGSMRELACNHIALVEAGRCGPDVTASER